ncbi:hypothetical protein F8388_008667 [Cannabis sativa]|uniref:Uncharacterized protein n=1 Tax=Cannabis sativa TaxID=3483 RepID=A0A7J6GGU2_CANSA|nr:hypothetical protein F8388_008667 [Cannabis sativa]
MSREDDEKRLYQSVRKYDKIVAQFDDLIDIMNSKTKLPKRRKAPSGSKGNTSTSAPPSSTVQNTDNNEGGGNKPIKRIVYTPTSKTEKPMLLFESLLVSSKASPPKEMT